MRGLVVVCCLVFLAGCLEESPPPVEADVAPEDPGRTARQGRGDREERDEEEEVARSDEVTRRSYSGQHGFTLTSASGFVSFGNLLGSNCVAFEGAPFTILNGTATLTWTSQSPLTDTLDLAIRTYWDDAVDETYAGTSPFVAEFRDIEVEADPDFEERLIFAVELAGPAGAAYEQDVTVDLAFHYESDVDVDPSSSC